jgi:hypothetical protein
MHEITYKEDVKDKTYTNNVDVPGAVVNTDSNNHGPKDGQNNCMAGKTRTRRLAVTAIASESEGGPEGITKLTKYELEILI